ncbi:hypothetical protein DE146DRAFT_651167 [Phaeosphaeria sp. MPI-PUGE-AT-0046c]|nr:hypothetical protein DE146DRAFT_651167 [Phaeosphaeria sp. MPI-PUGE-AT-0046c]
MTRAQARAAGDAELFAALNSDEPDRAAKKTKIPPGVGLEQIPSPGNLKVMRGMRGVTREATGGLQKVIEDFDELNLGKNTGCKASKKGKEKELAVEEEETGQEVKATRVTRSKSATGKGKGRANIASTAGKTPPTSPISEDSDEEIKDFELNPIIPPSLQSRVTKSNPTTSNLDEAGNEALLASLTPFLSQKKLWEMDEEDVAGLRAAAEGAESSSKREMVIKGMLDVVEKFQAFRDGLDEYMEEMEEMGLELKWEDDGREDE